MSDSVIFFSLVLATIYRTNEVDNFLRSICDQDFNHSKIEIIVIDQNVDSRLDSIIKKYLELGLNLRHIRSKLKGVSSNRNLGVSHAKGICLAFPDDDCIYYSNTLALVYDIFQQNPSYDFMCGRIYDRTLNINLIRDWPLKSKQIKTYNFFFLYSMITIFTKKRFLFDENFGGGSIFPAYEDSDFVYGLVKSGHLGYYSPKIEVWHPQLNINSMAIQKIIDYGFGFGAFCSKNKSFYFYFLFCVSILRHSFGLITSILLIDTIGFRKRFNSIESRFRGWNYYSIHEK